LGLVEGILGVPLFLAYRLLPDIFNPTGLVVAKCRSALLTGSPHHYLIFFHARGGQGLESFVR